MTLLAEAAEPREITYSFFSSVCAASRFDPESEYATRLWRRAWRLTQWTWRAGFRKESLPPSFNQRIARALKGMPQHPGKSLISNDWTNLRDLLAPLELTALVSVEAGEELHGPRVVFEVEVRTKDSGLITTLTPNLFCEAAPFRPSLRGYWGVNPVSCLRNVRSSGEPLPLPVEAH